MRSIVSHISSMMPARSNRYDVYIVDRNNTINMPENVSLQCNALQVPGRSLDYSMNRKYGIGLQSVSIENKAYPEFTLTFYESEKEVERQFFINWFDQIIDPVTNRVSFYNEYVKNMIIHQKNLKDEIVYEATVLDCIPVNITSLERNYNPMEAVPQFSVVFRCRDINEKFSQ